MGSPAVLTPLRRRRSPSLEALLAPVELADGGLIRALLSVARELVSSSLGRKIVFQCKNSRCLIRKIEAFVVVLESVKESGRFYSCTALLCFRELYLLLYRSKILLEYCAQSSKLWLLVQNVVVSGYFSDLNQEFSTFLDVFPVEEFCFSVDVREQIELVQRQLKKAGLYVDEEDERLRQRLYAFLNEFGDGRVPDCAELGLFFVDRLGIRDAKGCRDEIEFLEERICRHEGETEPSAPVLSGFVALARYCRFRLFGFEEDEMEGVSVRKNQRMMMKKGLVTQEIANSFVTVPKDFCCPISLDLMVDPVIVSTGQTYDRSSIRRWMDEGHLTCPKTGQMLTNKHLVSNRALRNLIMQWCSASGITLDAPDGADPSLEALAALLFSKAAFEANRATVGLLIQQLAQGSEDAKAIAAREVRLLAKTGKENRAHMAEAGAIQHLCKLLLSHNAVAQENSVTAILNLSIHEKNKTLIMEEEGCLELIVNVLRSGHTTESRENAAATLFSLSAIHNYKTRIADTEGAVEGLTNLLKEGSIRGKKDAVTALFNLSTHSQNCARILEAGASSALVGALEVEGVTEEAAGALALIVRQPVGAAAVGNDESAVAGLIGMMRSGTPKGKENAVAALLELCRSGGDAVSERVLKAPTLATLIQNLLFTGTKRARRKAASLARAFQRRENAGLHYGGLGVGYTIGRSSGGNRDSGYSGEVTLSMSISVPVV